MNSFLLPSLSRAINAYLSLDPTSLSRLKKLSGQVVTIELLPFHFIFQCVFSENDVSLQSGADLAARTKLTGTPLQLMGVMMAKDNRQRFFADDVVIEGSADLGQQVIALFDEIHIDWEEYTSRALGDVPAYHLSRIASGMSKWLRGANQSLSDNINEFIHEEAIWLPSREALQDFFNDVDALRMDVDRMEAKMAQLDAFLTNHKDTQ